MIIVEDKILCMKHTMESIKHHIPQQYTKYNLYVYDADKYWDEKIKGLFSKYNLQVDLQGVLSIYDEWVKAPVFLASENDTFRFFSVSAHEGKLISKLQSTQMKVFKDADQLFYVIVGNYRAAKSRKEEEVFAYQVLSSFPSYEESFLDDLLMKLFDLIKDKYKDIYENSKNSQSYTNSLCRYGIVLVPLTPACAVLSNSGRVPDEQTDSDHL
jgi:hypothetical protein